MRADQLWGPFKMVKYMATFGEQGYFATIPSKFISDDGKTMWLSYSANFWGWSSEPGSPRVQPDGACYAWCLTEFTVNK